MSAVEVSKMDKTPFRNVGPGVSFLKLLAITKRSL